MKREDIIEKIIHMLQDSDFKLLMIIYNFSLGILSKGDSDPEKN